MFVRNESWNTLDTDTRHACAYLWELVWPSTEIADVNTRLRRMDTRSEGLDNELLHLATDEDDRLVAVARTFEHTIGYGSTERRIMALASVCSNPNRRGEGFGEAVTQAAFQRVDAAGIHSLFQTPVPEFYERFDSTYIDNVITTSKPGAKTFWERYVMVYAGRDDVAWDNTVTIDLRSHAW